MVLAVHLAESSGCPMPGCPVAWSNFELAAAAVFVRCPWEATRGAAHRLHTALLGQPLLGLSRRFCSSTQWRIHGAAVDVRTHHQRSLSLSSWSPSETLVQQGLRQRSTFLQERVGGQRRLILWWATRADCCTQRVDSALGFVFKGSLVSCVEH